MTPSPQVLEEIDELDLEGITQIRKALDARVEVLTAEFKSLAAAASGKTCKPRAKSSKHE